MGSFGVCSDAKNGLGKLISQHFYEATGHKSGCKAEFSKFSHTHLSGVPPAWGETPFTHSPRKALLRDMSRMSQKMCLASPRSVVPRRQVGSFSAVASSVHAYGVAPRMSGG